MLTLSFTSKLRRSVPLCALAVFSCTAALHAAGTTSSVLWSADFETGNTSQWYAPSTGPTGDYGGGEYNSGSADSQISRDYAHSGSYSLKMNITTPPESGTRMFRWREPHANNKLHYSAWYYMPQKYSVKNYWNVFQWKSKRSSGQVDPFFVLNIGNRSDGTMYYYLRDWQQGKSYGQTIKNIQVGKWTKVEANYTCAADNTGRVTFWQDGVLLFDVPNVRTRYSDGDCQWSVDNYSDGLTPSNATTYVDDATISTDSAPSSDSGSGTGGTTQPTTTPVTISTSSLPAGATGTAYSANVAASGGFTPYKWSVASGQLPPGLTLSSQGAITGTPTTGGQYSFSVRATDASNATANSNLSIQVSSPARVLWSADFETGNTTQWYAPATAANGNEGGGEFNSGSADSQASQEHAHGGAWSLKMNINTPPESGTRMFRWLEPHNNNKLYYSAWYYVPQRYSVARYWNMFQWKSKRSSGQVDPFWVLTVGNRSDGSMYYYLYDWQQRKAYSQSVKNIPVGQWTKVEAYYQCAADNTGRVTFWQDGALLFDVPNVRTRYSDGDCQWSVDNYSDGLTPSNATIFLDDAQIYTK